jgi:hypothetical protein
MWPFTRRTGGEFVKGKHGIFRLSRSKFGTTVILASFLNYRFLRRRVGGAEPGLQSIRRQAQAGRKRTCPEGCPDFCLSADVTSVVGSKGVVKLNIDPIVRSETGQGPE